MPPLIYMDSCAPQRVLDDLTTSESLREREAMERIIPAIELGEVELVWSTFLTLELITWMPPEKMSRRLLGEHLRSLSRHHVEATPELGKRADELVRVAAIKPLDALHVASAESANAIFITVDRKGFLERVRRSGASRTIVMSPPELVTHLGLVQR